MAEREDPVIIAGPTVTMFEPAWLRDTRYWSGIVYSVQLINGSIITSPEKFPDSAPRARAP